MILRRGFRPRHIHHIRADRFGRPVQNDFIVEVLLEPDGIPEPVGIIMAKGRRQPGGGPTGTIRHTQFIKFI